MPRYTPILVSPAITCSSSDLVELHWKEDRLSADFAIPSDGARLLRVEFDRVEMVRLLDEMPLSTEDEETANEGLLRDNLAYRVEGAAFLKHQSEAFRIVYPKIKHYRFVTGGACLDVLSNGEPRFATVRRSIP